MSSEKSRKSFFINSHLVYALHFFQVLKKFFFVQYFMSSKVDDDERINSCNYDKQGFINTR